jgi:hypothetical protein
VPNIGSAKAAAIMSLRMSFLPYLAFLGYWLGRIPQWSNIQAIRPIGPPVLDCEPRLHTPQARRPAGG